MSPTDAPRKHTEGRPIVRRFVIKRLPLAIPSTAPWKVRDRSRPAYLGSAETLGDALAIVNRKLAEEGRFAPLVNEGGLTALDYDSAVA